MNDISKIIFDVLAAGQGVNLPEVGSLHVERDPAKFASKKEIKAPVQRVVFSRKQDQELDSIVKLLVDASGGDEAAATEAYDAWRQETGRDNDITEIPGVGVVKSGFFYPSVGLHEALNPMGDKAVEVTRKKHTARTVIIILLAVIIAAALICYFACPDTFRKCSSLFGKKPAVENTEGAAAQSGETQAAGEIATPQKDIAEIQAEAAKITEAASRQSAQAAQGQKTYYIVAGVFDFQENADKLIARDPFRIGRSEYIKLPYKDGLTMVAVYSTTDQADAEAKRRAFMSYDPEVWVHTRKK